MLPLYADRRKEGRRAGSGRPTGSAMADSAPSQNAGAAPADDADRHLLSCRALHKTYVIPGKKRVKGAELQVLRGIDLDIERGEIAVQVGQEAYRPGGWWVRHRAILAPRGLVCWTTLAPRRGRLILGRGERSE